MISIYFEYLHGTDFAQQFFNKFIDSIIQKRAKHLKIDKVKGIRMVRKNTLPKDSLARPVDGYIHLSDVLVEYLVKAGVYNPLGDIDIDILNRDKLTKYYLNLIDVTVYHELIHFDLEEKLPNIHYMKKMFENDKIISLEDIYKDWAIVFWIEYIAEYKSSKLQYIKRVREFNNSFIIRYNVSENANNICQLTKHAAYFIANIKSKGEYQAYFDKLTVPFVRNFILNLTEMVNQNMEMYGFNKDEYSILVPIEKYIAEMDKLVSAD